MQYSKQLPSSELEKDKGNACFTTCKIRLDLRPPFLPFAVQASLVSNKYHCYLRFFFLFLFFPGRKSLLLVIPTKRPNIWELGQETWHLSSETYKTRVCYDFLGRHLSRRFGKEYKKLTPSLISDFATSINQVRDWHQRSPSML